MTVMLALLASAWADPSAPMVQNRVNTDGRSAGNMGGGTPMFAKHGGDDDTHMRMADCVDMHMGGFSLAGADKHCLVLLFKSWRVDSACRMAFGAFATFMLAYAFQALAWHRHNGMTARALPLLARRPLAWRLASTALFTLQAALAYILMLLAMTYQAEIFLAVVAGLAVGHFQCSAAPPLGAASVAPHAAADPCCVVGENSPLPQREPPPDHAVVGGRSALAILV
eukprot:CAMPEP_0119378676 /NCGR_PEP_ID=MMETSP1334-20130426/49348_1 /TAXON_ID=127549 /ORGANISM="Calcidiscus leptoporus, Strain RCC1130" /LENGTH=225 /DNA_ID=CAMNT_0007397959 /DNA_START=42 /DNA_END=719 /DNA_ORIENTATION=+